MMRRFALAIATSCVLSVPMVAAQDGESTEGEERAPLQVRNFDHLEFDTVTGTYFGVAMFYTEDDKAVFDGYKTNQAVFSTELRILMGGESFQGGFVIPYHTTDSDAFGSGEGDIGQVRAHLKAIPVRGDLFDFGGGLMLTFPSGGDSSTINPGGSEDDEASTTLPFAPDEVGVLPFVTGTVHAGPIDVNAHIGYEFVNHNQGIGRPESILYGGSATWPVLDMLGLRLELAGQQFTSGEDRNVVAIEPGVDVLLPLFGWDFVLSASGAYGLSGGAAGLDGGYGSRWGLNTHSGLSRGEWGVGFALGALWN